MPISGFVTNTADCSEDEQFQNFFYLLQIEASTANERALYYLKCCNSESNVLITAFFQV